MGDAPWIDLLDGKFYVDDVHSAFAWMRANDPVYYDEKNNLWAISKHRDVKNVEKDPETFANGGGSRPEVGPVSMMIDMDAPEHIKRRRLVSEGFTPRRVRDMEDNIRKICDSLIDDVAEKGSCDLVADLAAPLPLIVIGNMLGVKPEDRADLLRWSDDLLVAQGSDDPAKLEAMMAAFAEYTTYILGVIEERRETGQDDDLIGVLVNAEIEGERLDESSLIHESLLILIGGDETTRHVISGGTEQLILHPEYYAALGSDSSLMPRAVEEMLRWVTPIKNMARTVTRDVEIRGKKIPEGVKLILLYPSANRDEEVFENPNVFDIYRNPNDHVAFGFGAHFCLGNQLARMEMRMMFEQLTKRLPDLSLATDEPLPLRPASFVSGIETMPVKFTPTTKVGVGPV
jgi:cholest-4-en-3-one 26-monooxygenase